MIEDATGHAQEYIRCSLARWPRTAITAGRAGAAMAGIPADALAVCSGTTYRGERLMRISVSDWATDTGERHRVVQGLPRHAEQENT